MTPKERFYPKILNASRKQQYCPRGRGWVSDINILLTRFEESQQFAKLFKKFGRGPTYLNKQRLILLYQKE